MHLPKLYSTLLIGTAALIGLAALVMLTGSGAGASPARNARAEADAVTPSCPTAGLVVWLNTLSGGGAAGSYYYDLDFTNLSGHACSLLGYPGVSAVSLGGRQLGSPASRNRTSKAKLVELANGETASALLRLVNAANYSAAQCRQVVAAGLRVYPPNQTKSKIVPFPFSACSRSGPQFLSIEAVKKAEISFTT
jgi:hypothetical protein